MASEEIIAILRQRREEIRAKGVRSLALIGLASHAPGSALEFLAALDPPQTYEHLREVQRWISTLLGQPVDLTLADPRSPEVQPYLDPQAVYIL